MAMLSPLLFKKYYRQETPFSTHYSPFTCMNYVRHLNAFFAFVRSDKRLTSSHVSLYMALFQYWNFNRFNNPFSIYRDNIMQLSKLSKNTYHKCIKELHEAKYIYYHPSPSKFQAVRISVIRMDKEEEQPSKYQQLDLFTGHKIETDSVANLIPHSHNINTGRVTDLRHNIKPNIKQERNTPSKIFKKNDKIQKAVNDFGGVANSVHSELLTEIPPLDEIQHHFFNHNYPSEEATKFYNHYKALGWRIQGKTPITDWKPLVEKWMANANKWNTTGSKAVIANTAKQSPATEINFLYESFLDGKKIFHHIATDHFDQLNLSLDDEVMIQARQQRINDVSGTNQHSINEIWKAYLTGDDNNAIVIKDKPNLIAIAKRIAVLNHFQSLKQQSQ